MKFKSLVKWQCILSLCFFSVVSLGGSPTYLCYKCDSPSGCISYDYGKWPKGSSCKEATNGSCKYCEKTATDRRHARHQCTITKGYGASPCHR